MSSISTNKKSLIVEKGKCSICEIEIIPPASFFTMREYGFCSKKCLRIFQKEYLPSIVSIEDKKQNSFRFINDGNGNCC